ncbi:C-C chemokine receptor-like 2 [Echinops telfairi]|uniref:C-C chemokine receptor-like 2 n=1 Tax=Echinops telfairi TaxID=9371 RepID=A0ABM0INN5_ECHTE|nr:C-C chemokine receptor-like 2 [Echinops telfairi]
MDNYTAAPEDDYDVLIEGDLNHSVTEQCDPYQPKLLSAQLLPKLYPLVFVVCLLLNLLVLHILVKHKGLRRLDNVYFLNLAISNVLFSLTLPFWAHSASHGWALGDRECMLLVGVYTVGLYSEACLNMLLTVHRYLVVHQVQCMSRSSRKVPWGFLTSVLVWTVAVLVTLPEHTVDRPRVQGWEDKCLYSRPTFLPADETWQWFLTLEMNILGLLLPLLVFLYCHAQVSRTRSFREKRGDLYKLTLATTAIFLLMWAPYNIALLLSTFKEHFSLQDCKSAYGLHRAVHITEILAATHCGINPLLHVVFDTAFRRHLYHLLHLQPRAQVRQASSQEPQEPFTRV